MAASLSKHRLFENYQIQLKTIVFVKCRDAFRFHYQLFVDTGLTEVTALSVLIRWPAAVLPNHNEIGRAHV